MRRWSRALHAALALLLAGCSAVATQQLGYTPLGDPAPRPVAERLTVVPFSDGRPARGQPAAIDPAVVLLLPLVPSVSTDYERLDESRAAELLLRGALPQRDDLFEDVLARAVAADLQASRLFDDVTYAVAPPADAALILGGTIASTRFTVTETSYLLGAPGMVLWATGLPNGRDSAEVEIDLELRDRGGAVLWRYPLHASVSRLVNLYAPGYQLSTGAGALWVPRYGANEQGIDPDSLWAFYSEALRTGMAAARRSLAAYLAAAG